MKYPKTTILIILLLSVLACKKSSNSPVTTIMGTYVGKAHISWTNVKRYGTGLFTSFDTVTTADTFFVTMKRNDSFSYVTTANVPILMGGCAKYYSANVYTASQVLGSTDVKTTELQFLPDQDSLIYSYYSKSTTGIGGTSEAHDTFWGKRIKR